MMRLILSTAKVTEVTNQMKLMRSSLESAKHELSEYKEKATRILQVGYLPRKLYRC